MSFARVGSIPIIINDTVKFTPPVVLDVGGIYNLTALAETVSGDTIGILALEAKPDQSNVWTIVDQLPLNKVGILVVEANAGGASVRMRYIQSNANTPDTRVYITGIRHVSVGG